MRDHLSNRGKEKHESDPRLRLFGVEVYDRQDKMIAHIAFKTKKKRYW